MEVEWEVELVWPQDSPMPVVGGRWRRERSGEIHAWYSRQELELCLAIYRLLFSASAAVQPVLGDWSGL